MGLKFSEAWARRLNNDVGDHVATRQTHRRFWQRVCGSIERRLSLVSFFGENLAAAAFGTFATLSARKRTSLESRLFGAVPPAERRLSAQPSPPSNKPQHGRSVPQPWRGHLSGDRSILYKLGYVVTEIGETQRILPHAISQELTLSSSGALIAATAPSPRPVTVRVTQPGLATVIQYDLRMP